MVKVTCRSFDFCINPHEVIVTINSNTCGYILVLLQVDNSSATSLGGKALLKRLFADNNIICSLCVGPFQIYVAVDSTLIVVLAVADDNILALVVGGDCHPVVHLSIERAGAVHGLIVAGGHCGALHTHVSHDASQVDGICT